MSGEAVKRHKSLKRLINDSAGLISCRKKNKSQPSVNEKTPHGERNDCWNTHTPSAVGAISHTYVT